MLLARLSNARLFVSQIFYQVLFAPETARLAERRIRLMDFVVGCATSRYYICRDCSVSFCVSFSPRHLEWGH